MPTYNAAMFYVVFVFVFGWFVRCDVWSSPFCRGGSGAAMCGRWFVINIWVHRRSQMRGCLVRDVRIVIADLSCLLCLVSYDYFMYKVSVWCYVYWLCDNKEIYKISMLFLWNIRHMWCEICDGSCILENSAKLQQIRSKYENVFENNPVFYFSEIKQINEI